MKKWQKNTKEAFGQIMIVECDKQPSYEEIVEIKKSTGETTYGKVIEARENIAVVQVFGNIIGADTKQTYTHFTGATQKFGVSEAMLGRVFSGFGELIDGGPEIIADQELDINGYPINPYSRSKPFEYMETGISTIDCMNTLVKGQKLPIFSISGLPHSDLAAQIARQANVPNSEKESDFVIVFGAIGITTQESNFFIEEFKNTGALGRTVLFTNLASDPVIERITLPRLVLTTAEYLAYEKGKDVLVIMTDITNYCNALREISSARKEVPGRRSYPGYLYTDLAMLYERCGTVNGATGSITQVPILTMPDGDRTHPVVDLTGYITEGQVQLSRELHNRGVYPPTDLLNSLSRLKPGKGQVRDDQSGLANQLYASYARGLNVKELALVIGESSLSEDDKKFLEFADAFETKFIAQALDENRSMEKTLEIGWELLKILPIRELKRVKPEHIEQYMKGNV